ncbi:endonuclease III domain-containing protein [Candidatus Macondimonas diazotrophica]|uniref:Endonuclease n=1 Tax=Candidatus Macondimonas diazotrophica TaxID=2305248 RepID=A0A4Z0FCH5_9GAMM|nr:endonuclease [Candidatus Macondimonas diazotrophica]TFZ83484.1 endonuclease [Candidatus Macondimonas diazotrophica]
MNDLYARLLAAYGAQDWWPAETPFEVMVGAVLTQNTTWIQVERVIERLRAAELLRPAPLRDLPIETLAELIRPAGYPRVKTRRLQTLCAWLIARGDLAGLIDRPTDVLRAELLAVHGVGPETADSILLYALGRPVFVIDAYTRRILSRYGLITGKEPYESLRRLVESRLHTDDPVRDYNELHALLVRHAKTACRVRPQCTACCLRAGCDASQTSGP